MFEVTGETRQIDACLLCPVVCDPARQSGEYGKRYFAVWRKGLRTLGVKMPDADYPPNKYRPRARSVRAELAAVTRAMARCRRDLAALEQAVLRLAQTMAVAADAPHVTTRAVVGRDNGLGGEPTARRNRISAQATAIRARKGQPRPGGSAVGQLDTRGASGRGAEVWLLSLFRRVASLTTRQINDAWENAGRTGTADRLLRRLEKAGKLSRTALKAQRGTCTRWRKHIPRSAREERSPGAVASGKLRNVS
jgi:hypothetical protein